MYRKKWKDAVDLYFIMQKEKISFSKIIARAKSIFTDLYKEEASLETILEDDWDLSEKVEYLGTSFPPDGEVRKFLQRKAKEYLTVSVN